MIPKELLPRPALRIGVSGRRVLTVSNGVDAQGAPSKKDVTKRVHEVVGEVLSLIKEIAKEEFHKARQLYQAEEPRYYALSPLAEGADRVFAEEAKRVGYELESPLPFFREEYARDFSTPDSKSKFHELLMYAGDNVLELDGQRSPKPAESAAYEAAGRVVVDQCDLLVAIWDGEPDKGWGGTSGIIDFATNSGKVPVICVRIDTDSIEIYDRAGRRHPKLYSPEELRGLIEHIVVPPWYKHGRSGDVDLTGSYIEGLSAKGTILGWFWKQFLRFTMLGKNPRQVHRAQRVPEGPFLRFYNPFDGYANRLAGLYRGAFLLNYILGVLAVAIALVGSGVQGGPDPIHIVHTTIDRELAVKGFVALELVTIGIILLIGILLGKKRWHYRSVDCRYLGEQFRVLCYLHTLALSPPHPRLPAHHMEHNVQKSWMEWLLRGVVRETPMTPGKFSEERLEHERTKILGWVRGQIHYHSINAVKLELIGERLHIAVWVSLALIVLAGIIHISGWRGNDLVLLWLLTAIATGFPAFSSACHAISSQGEFERLAERSKAMRENLEIVAQELGKMGSQGSYTVGELREVARSVAELAVEEVVDWQILYRKPVPPP